MNRKEIAEIRKLLCMQKNPIHTIYGCYVNSEKDLLSEFKHPALSLPEDELFKYLDIFRKALSGKKEKNLTQVDFPLSEESAGGTQHFLYQFCAFQTCVCYDVEQRSLESFRRCKLSI